MRISTQEQQHIVTAITEQFGLDAQVYLFGSRVDDSKKGGDIDLLVVTKTQDALFEKKIAALTKLQKELGLQKIDLVITCKENDYRLIVREALKTGILLTGN